MNKAKEFYKTHRQAIIWTVWYIAIMWAILYGLFNFNMFNGVQWDRLFHAQLRGFPGFVFGILILSALPLYVATTILIDRNKKPLFTIPVPEFIKKMLPQKAEKKSDDSASDNQTTQKKPEPAPLPSDIPSELRPHYIRARLQKTSFGTLAVNTAYANGIQEQNAATNTNSDTSNDEQLTDLPLPSDFDIETPEDFGEAAVFGAPTFTEVNFDTDNSNTPETLNNYLTENNIAFETSDDLIITDKHVIASHTDPEFWIADEDTWFAAGEKRDSPVNKILDIAKSKNLIPVLYLGTTNIMDLDKNTELWTTMGICVITSPDQLPN